MPKKPMTAQAKGKAKKNAADSAKARTYADPGGAQGMAKQLVTRGKPPDTSAAQGIKDPAKRRAAGVSLAIGEVEASSAAMRRAVRNKTPGGSGKKKK